MEASASPPFVYTNTSLEALEMQRRACPHCLLDKSGIIVSVEGKLFEFFGVLNRLDALDLEVASFGVGEHHRRRGSQTLV